MITLDVPETITREQYTALLRAAGFENLRDLVSLEFTATGIYAVAFALDENGRRYRDGAVGSNEPAKHRVHIRLVDDE